MKVKLFTTKTRAGFDTDKATTDLEDKINKFLEENPKISNVNFQYFSFAVLHNDRDLWCEKSILITYEVAK